MSQYQISIHPFSWAPQCSSLYIQLVCEGSIPVGDTKTLSGCIKKGVELPNHTCGATCCSNPHAESSLSDSGSQKPIPPGSVYPRQAASLSQG